MERYDYLEVVTNDVKGYIESEITMSDYSDRDELEEYLNEVLWTNDGVTGNGSGSYTFNKWEAEENLCHNLDLLGEALNEFGCEASYLVEKGAESCDVAIRCYLLNQAISAALDELWEDEDEDDDD
jgi:hypothetical protein